MAEGLMNGLLFIRRILVGDLSADNALDRPACDQKLCALLAEQGCVISRRTAAKYREELNIPGTAGRRLP